MAIPTITANIKTGMSQCDEEDLQGLARTRIKISGVVDRSLDHFKVEAESPASKNIKINSGEAWVHGEPTDNLSDIQLGIMASDGTLTVSDNISGNDRIDAVVLHWDTNTVPDATASNLFDITIVEGTPAATPTAPSDSDVETDIGTDKGWIRLANIAVANGFTQITDTEITDKRVQANSNDPSAGASIYADHYPSIQDAIDALPTTGTYIGGVVHLSPRDYTITAPITIPDNVSLVGCGQRITKIVMDGIAAYDGGINLQGQNILLRDLWVYGDGTSDAFGVYVYNQDYSVSGLRLDNVRVSNVNANALRIDPNAGYNTFGVNIASSTLENTDMAKNTVYIDRTQDSQIVGNLIQCAGGGGAKYSIELGSNTGANVIIGNTLDDSVLDNGSNLVANNVAT